MWATKRDPSDAEDPAHVITGTPAVRRRQAPFVLVPIVVRLDRILRDYDETGSVNILLALWGFRRRLHVPEESWARGTRPMVLQVEAVEVHSGQPVRDVVHRFEAALRLLDEHCRVYQYLSKRRIELIAPAACFHPITPEAVQRRTDYLNGRPEELFELDLYLVLV